MRLPVVHGAPRPLPFYSVTGRGDALVAHSMERKRRAKPASTPRAHSSTRSPSPSRSSSTTDQKVSQSAASVGMLKSMGGVPGGYCAGEGDNGGKLTTHMIGGGTAGVNAVKTRQDQCSSTRARWYRFGLLDPKAPSIWHGSGAGLAAVGGGHQ